MVEPSRKLSLEPLVRIGTVDGAPETQWGSVVSLQVEVDAGEVYVGDGVSNRLRVFGVDGAFRRAWGRSGDGPGEFNGGPLVSVGRDTVVATDGFRVNVFTAEGEVIRTFTPRPLERVSFLESISPVDDGWIALIREVVPGRGQLRRAYAMDLAGLLTGEPVLEVPYQEAGTPSLFAPRARVAHHGDGIVVSDAVEYRIERRGPRGRVQSVHRFTDALVAVSEADFDRYETATDARCRASDGAALCVPLLDDHFSAVRRRGLPAARPVVGRLLGSADGTILVQRADLDPTPFTPGDETLWDLVADDGRWLGRIEFPLGMRPVWLGADQIWGVELDAFDVPTVVGYRIRVVE